MVTKVERKIGMDIRSNPKYLLAKMVVQQRLSCKMENVQRLFLCEEVEPEANAGRKIGPLEIG